LKAALDLGFIALTDAAPLIVAKTHGLFADEGLDVSLHREVSWATIRDKVAAGVFQGAHMLAPMAIAANVGVGSERAQVVVPMSLNAHGAGIGVSATLADEMAQADPAAPLSAAALAGAVANRLKSGRPAISFAVVFPYSMHNYMLRFWAADAGVDPDDDIRIVVAPPTAIAARLKSGEIDGFCVGAPWGALCEAESGAKVALHAADFWAGGPDKVLGVSSTWADRDSSQMLALMRALMRGAQWADDAANVPELASLLARPEWLNAAEGLIVQRLAPGAPQSLRFARHTALYPWRSHAAWIASQMIRWDQAPVDIDLDRALACYRPDMFHIAAAEIGLNAPIADSKSEGAHDTIWSLNGRTGSIEMTPDRLPGNAEFVPERVREYAASFPITRAKR
jgi:ABC-type nitrate/sulfonate/bicarbonate transport system substrate-binding protein